MKEKIIMLDIVTLKKIIEDTSLQTATRVVEDLKSRDMIKSETEKDLTIQDIIELTGISKNFAYGCQYYGEYTITGKNGLKIRRIRREVFERRRAQGKPINKDCTL